MNRINLKYLVVSEQDLSWGLVVNNVGYQQIPKHVLYPLRDHPDGYFFSTEKGRVLQEYQLIYITRGRGKFKSDNCKQQAVHEGNIFLLFPGEWHSYMPDRDTGWDEYWIGFTGEDIDNRVMNNFFNPNKAVFNVGINHEIVNLYKYAIEIAQEQKSGYQQMLAGIVNLLLGHTYSLDKSLFFDESEISKQISRAKIIMVEHLLSGIKPEEIASKLNISYSWLRKSFKEYTGLAPSQYFNELRMRKVKEFLRNTTMSIKEISFEMNFENPEYFYRAFKKNSGMTPLQYREFSQVKRHN